MVVDVLTALALLLVLEGILPFASPRVLRQVLVQAAQLDDHTLRAAGLVSMLLGLALLYLVRH